MCGAFKKFVDTGSFEDRLVCFQNKFVGMRSDYRILPSTFQEVIECFSDNDYQSLTYKSSFYKLLIDLFKKGWVDIEREYFQRLKLLFNITNISESSRLKQVTQLNQDFDHIIALLTEYITYINDSIKDCKKLPLTNARLNFTKAFKMDEKAPVTFVNFNYTETLLGLGYADEYQIIHIHGKASDVTHNPIIFGYGDETDPAYQKIEDSGENIYLNHSKSFAYFKTNNYAKLISIIDSDPYDVFIFGLSCGMSDRVLLSEIFEHRNCKSIEIFYHQRSDSSDNFQEITQEISRHFKPQNKGLMRRRIVPKSSGCIIPQQH